MDRLLRVDCRSSLVALLSFLLEGSNSVGGRVATVYLVGFLLAFGPFDQVIVTGLHVFFGILCFAELVTVMGVVTAGNLVGGVRLVMLSHVAQAKGASE